MRLPCLALLLALLALVGCARRDPSKTDMVPLEKVPDVVMKVAREKLPDVQFDTAWKTPNGNFEVRGKEKTGKVRDIQVTPKGDVVEVD